MEATVWGARWCVRRWERALLASLLLVLALVASASTGASPAPAGESVSVIVRELAGAGQGPERAVTGLGGSVRRHIGVIDGFVADVPARALGALETAPGVYSVTRNARVQLSSVDGWDPTDDLGSMYFVAGEVTGAGEYWNDGYTGKGVDVAVIDSGVVPVDGLATPGKVIHGPDLSFESQADNLRHLDTFGHGTHMAGIIAGRDSAVTKVTKGDTSHFIGMAPDARLVSVKVADAYGITDTSQVIAAIDWVVQHRHDNGMNIRVLNLSFGTDGTQDYRIDPLAYAAEVAWREGIVVVVSAGNGGFGTSKLNNPAYDPFVIAVGSSDGKGTYDHKDDVVPTWSSYGDGGRNPDLVAPGKSIVSLRAPGSSIDADNLEGRVGTTPRFFRGSGTSQAAAVVSGAAALIIQQRPGISPDQVKKLLTSTARPLPAADAKGQGAGAIDLKVARDRSTPSPSSAAQPFALSTGTGSLELTRGSDHLDDGTAVLEGERDVFGAVWDGATWAPASLAGTTWAGGLWNGNRWSGDDWSGNRWSSAVWTGNRWSGNRWDSTSWSGNRWSGNRWDGSGWSGNRWSGNRWSGDRWSSAGWGG